MMTTGVPRTHRRDALPHGVRARVHLQHRQLDVLHEVFRRRAGAARALCVVLAIVDAIALLALCDRLVSARARLRNVGGRAPTYEAQGVPAVALLTPLLPLLLYYALHLEAAPAFLMAGDLRGARHAAARGGAALGRGGDSRRGRCRAGAAALHGDRHAARRDASSRSSSPRCRRWSAASWLRNPVAYVASSAWRSPLVLYRGPLNPFGVGIAIFTVLLTAHVLPPVLLVAAVMAVVQVQNVCDPTNTANVWVANFTGVPIDGSPDARCRIKRRSRSSRRSPS